MSVRSTSAAQWTACASPRTLTALAQGSHSFRARARDAVGNVDATPAERTWTVDTQAPTTTIGTGPSGTVASASATFTFSSSEAGTLECRLDGVGAWTTCSSPRTLTGLGQGSHTFAIRARDAAGNVDATPAERTWVVDTQAPETSIDSGPPALAASESATLAFSATEGGSTFECRLDGAAQWTTCTSPRALTGLGEGSHTFQVRAKDAVGNVDSTPAERNWTVDTQAPTTTVDSGPVGHGGLSVGHPHVQLLRARDARVPPRRRRPVDHVHLAAHPHRPRPGITHLRRARP